MGRSSWNMRFIFTVMFALWLEVNMCAQETINNKRTKITPFQNLQAS